MLYHSLWSTQHSINFHVVWLVWLRIDDCIIFLIWLHFLHLRMWQLVNFYRWKQVFYRIQPFLNYENNILFLFKTLIPLFFNSSLKKLSPESLYCTNLSLALTTVNDLRGDYLPWNYYHSQTFWLNRKL